MLRTAFGAASRNHFLEHQVTTRQLPRSVALRFVAGDTLDDAIQVMHRLGATGMRSTADFLGESHASPDAAAAARDVILHATERMAGLPQPAGVSVKPTQVGLLVSHDVARANIERIAAATHDAGLNLTLDMEDHTVTEATVSLAEHLRAGGYPDVGCALQAYLHRTPHDVHRLSRTGVSVRLCKGAYDEPRAIAHRARRTVDASFRLCAEALLRHGTYPRIATHDDRLIAHVRAVADRWDVPRQAFEFQMLYGIRESLQRELVLAGYRVCVYVPYGRAWYRYFMRRLGERPANVMFFLRAVRSG